MTTLITGGNGKTGIHLAKILHDNGRPLLIASSKGTTAEPYKAVQFNWFDPSTFENPFKEDSNIENLYLISPPNLDPLPIAKPFIDLAISKGVKKIVLLGMTALEKGDTYVGKLHEYLDTLDVYYVVLRPTWFTENLFQAHIGSIKAGNKIQSLIEDGRLPLISTIDIAQIAYDAFYSTDKVWVKGRQPLLLGPEPLTYQQVADILSEVIGRNITYQKMVVGKERPAWFYLAPEDYQLFLDKLEADGRAGLEEAYLNSEKDKIIGKKTVREIIESNKAEF